MKFQHGDIRCTEDYEQLGDFDLLIDFAAEPSVQAGVAARRGTCSTTILWERCTAWKRRGGEARFVLLSTSRVYPMSTLNRLEWREEPDRFRWVGSDGLPGYSPRGIAEEFPLDGARSFYGGEQAGLRAVSRNTSSSRPECRNQPLRRVGRPLADGQGRSGRRHLVGGKPLLPQVVLLRWLRRHGASRSATCCTFTTCSTCW